MNPDLAGSGHPPPDLPAEVEQVRVLRLQPGDIIVARVHEAIPMAQAKTTVDRLKEIFKGHEVLVCSGFTLEVARPGTPTWDAECDEFGCSYEDPQVGDGTFLRQAADHLQQRHGDAGPSA